MSDNLVISVSNVGKLYRIWEDPAARIIAPLLGKAADVLPTRLLGARWLKAQATNRYRDFWALKGISFEVKKGEAVGIIGRNGSGKSTLLQIISSTLQPTDGSVKVKGRVAALLELGSGFNPEFTGRENVYLYGTILGLSRQEMDARFEAIATFADIGDFINQPVRIYSSGMVVRLAFAVAAHVDPDILIVDEALSVGDARFQLKCARAIDRFRERGVTLLFVSHDASMIKRLCSCAILLETGQMVYAGRPNDVVNLYSKLLADGGTMESLAPDITTLQANLPSADDSRVPAASPTSLPAPSTIPTSQLESVDHLRLRLKAMETVLLSRSDSAAVAQRIEQLWADERRHTQVTGQEFSYGGELGRIHEVLVHDANGQPRTWFTTGETITIRMTVEGHDNYSDPIFALTIKSAAGLEIYGTNTLFGRQPASPMAAGIKREIDFAFPLNLMPGHYFVSVGFTHYVGEELLVIHRRYDVIKLEVHGTDRTFGIANLHAKITAHDLPTITTH